MVAEMVNQEVLLLTVEQAAQRLQIGRRQAYEMCQRGTLPTVRIGKSVRVPVDKLREWIENNTQSS